MNELQSNFLKKAVPAAMVSQAATGVPASITIAQAAFESAWGCSGLSRRANNFFGIKAAHHVAPDTYIEMPTYEVIDGHTVEEEAEFARYASIADSFKAHGLLLSQASRYAPAMAVRNDPRQFATRLRLCGYSTQPDYAARLMKLVAEYDLTQYDLPATPAKENS